MKHGATSCLKSKFLQAFTAVNNQNQHQFNHIFTVIVQEEELQLHWHMCPDKESTLAKPQTNMLHKSEWISLWNSKHDPVLWLCGPVSD